MIVVVPVDPPRDGLVCTGLVEGTPLDASEATRLYRAATADVFRAVASSGGDLLVNYRDEETLPEKYASEGSDAEAEVRAIVVDALGEVDDDGVRLERQVGSTRAARVGNTVTHLLEREEVASVGVLEPTASLVRRTEIDSAAMAIRRNDVVLGPAPEGATYFTVFSDPIDFDGAYATPELATLAQRGADAGLAVGFAPMLPTITDAVGLGSTLAMLEARVTSGYPVPEATTTLVDELELVVDEEGTITRQ